VALADGTFLDVAMVERARTVLALADRRPPG
ncbi:CoA ester lyase, partial [Cellulosimicrobium cellulans]|nr:CoA ester lyase [Cellulosimicrobium cellulans]